MPPALKRKAAASDDVEDATSSKRGKYQALSHDELVDRIISLESEALTLHALIKTLKSKTEPTAFDKILKPNANATIAPPDWSNEKIAETTTKISDVMQKGIKKQMKWQPSCKSGTTKWSYTTVVPHVKVMQNILSLQEDGQKKAWKQRKVSSLDLQRSIGRVSASCRYNDLRITSDMVNAKWDDETKMLTLSGTYGILCTTAGPEFLRREWIRLAQCSEELECEIG